MSQLLDPNWNRAAILPYARHKQTGEGSWAVPGVLADLLSAVMLPGDVYQGNVLLNDPETGRTSDQVIRRSADLAGAMTLGAGAVPAEVNSLRMGMKAYHASPHEFDQFRPSEFRGATFFASTPERAMRAANAGRNEMVMDTATKLDAPNYKIYEVDIDDTKISGLHLTPKELDAWKKLPNEIIGDENLEKEWKAAGLGVYWDDVYDAEKIGDRLYRYVKKDAPPKISYEDAVKGGRDIYNRQWPHYNSSATDEKSAAMRVKESGMGGYLVRDEGGLSIAVADPSITKITKRGGK